MDFRLLQADHVGLMLLDNGFKLMGTGSQAVDIKRDKFHSRRQIAVGNVAGMLAENEEEWLWDWAAVLAWKGGNAFIKANIAPMPLLR